MLCLGGFELYSRWVPLIESVVYCFYDITFSSTESFCGFSTVIKSFPLSKVIISQS